MSDGVNVAVMSPSPMVRAGIRWILESTSRYLVVAEAEDLDQAITLLARHNPTVLIANVEDESQAVAWIQRLSATAPTHVLAVLPAQTEIELANMLRCGARGCVPTTVVAQELVMAVDQISRGTTYVSGMRPGEPTADGDRLTGREREVLDLVARGHTTRQIADRLKLSVRTIETQRASIRNKTGLQSRAELASHWRRLTRY